MYYLRSASSADAVKFTVQETKISAEDIKSELSCSIDNPDDCIACGS